MIEQYIKNTETLKKWKRFKANKKSLIACVALLFILFISVTAEFWANSKPILMFYEGHLYIPSLVHYHPSDLNLKTSLSTVDYRSITLAGKGWALWPLVKWDPFESNTKVAHYPAPPSKNNWLGTDDRGRDVLTRLIYGFRYSIGFALVVCFLSYLIGTFIGSLTGFIGGKLDLIGQRFVEVIETVPVLLLLITLVDLMGGGSFWLLVILMACFKWINISYYMRAEFLKLRKREFVDVGRLQGLSHLRIMFRHILPNALTPIVTFAPFSIANAISGLAFLDYLGFGLTPPTPSWGELLSQAEKYFTVAWWLALFPSLALFITLMILIFIGSGLREAFDPRVSASPLK